MKQLKVTETNYYKTLQLREYWSDKEDYYFKKHISASRRNKRFMAKMWYFCWKQADKRITIMTKAINDYTSREYQKQVKELEDSIEE